MEIVAFDFAWIKTRKNKDGSHSPIYIIVSQATANAHIKIRLQGIDAPELHYRIDQKKQEVRQNWGKRATLELRNFLKARASGTTIDCHVETLVKLPNDVFDMFGRFVGDIMIADGSKMVGLAVLRARGLTPTEIEGFCAMRHLDADIFLKIATTRDWIRRPLIALALVKNPKVPLTITLPLVKRLGMRDLRNIFRDRNLPEAIRNMARRVYMERRR